MQGVSPAFALLSALHKGTGTKQMRSWMDELEHTVEHQHKAAQLVRKATIRIRMEALTFNSLSAVGPQQTGPHSVVRVAAQHQQNAPLAGNIP